MQHDVSSNAIKSSTVSAWYDVGRLRVEKCEKK